MSIPRHIHQIWLGPRPVPGRWVAGWRRAHPGWAHTLWRESDVLPILPAGTVRVWDHYVSRQRWHGAADVARVAILLRHGGVYADVDSEVVTPFDEAPFMAASFFAGRALPTVTHAYRLANGVIGAEVDHPILVTYAEMIAQAERLEPVWDTVGGTMLTLAVAAHPGLAGVMILPTRVFYPEGMKGERAPGDETVYTRHYWASTYGLYGYQDESSAQLFARRVPARKTVRQRLPRVVRRFGRAVLRRIDAARGRSA